LYIAPFKTIGLNNLLSNRDKYSGSFFLEENKQ
jgi:hypothetical protein